MNIKDLTLVKGKKFVKGLINNLLRPYGCTQCKKKFMRSTTLKIHMRTHTKVKPFECPCCFKNFSESGNMKIHLRIHVLNFLF